MLLDNSYNNQAGTQAETDTTLYKYLSNQTEGFSDRQTSAKENKYTMLIDRLPSQVITSPLVGEARKLTWF